jgi:hypothetical protein
MFAAIDATSPFAAGESRTTDSVGFGATVDTGAEATGTDGSESDRGVLAEPVGASGFCAAVVSVCEQAQQAITAIQTAVPVRRSCMVI